MIIDRQLDTDVLVIGSGIAGLSAAIYAAKNGARVIICSSVNLFSGSTFFPGTWGFGLVGPENQKDEKDLISSILRLGQGVARESMVETFVRNLNESVDLLENLEITLEKPSEEAKEEKEYIPCFDHKHRRWRGLTKKNLLEALPKVLESLGIRLLPNFEVIELLKKKEKVVGVVGIEEGKTLEKVGAEAVILATGGLGGLYSYKLTTDDVDGSGVGLSLRAGAKAINPEFMQIMLGFIKPGFKTVHNEKTFFASRFFTKDGKDLLEKRLPEGISIEEVLSARSLHGPFSSETMSKHLDLAVLEEITEKDLKGVRMRYDLEKLKNPPEFVKTYFTWLKENKHIDMEDEILIAPFMHASNGGIYITEEGKTHVPGLFAAGECTGGMHGADRIGGLSTANGIVFGKISGENAALYCKKKKRIKEETIGSEKTSETAFSLQLSDDAHIKLKEMRTIMYKHAFLKLKEDGIQYAMEAYEHLRFIEDDEEISAERKDIVDIRKIRDSYRLLNAKASASVLLTVQKERKESRGSFYRSDYPERDDENFRKPFIAGLIEQKDEKTKEKSFKVLLKKLEKEEEIIW